MPDRKAPSPPPSPERSTAEGSPGAPIADRRDDFARTTPQTPEDKARTRAFIDGKIELIRRDRRLTDAEKASAIAELEAKR